MEVPTRVPMRVPMALSAVGVGATPRIVAVGQRVAAVDLSVGRPVGGPERRLAEELKPRPRATALWRCDQ
jgi:hypothetical protein